jgi:very-short-patch-repair endonuclease
MRSGLVSLARGLRRTETSAEAVLWSELRNRQMDGWKFKRQVPFGNYILDFFCYDARLAIEVDGATHSEAKEIAQDADRTAFLEANGVKLFRCSNTDIYENLDGVLEMIYLALGRQPAPSPCARKVRADAPGRRPLHVMAEPCFAWTGRGEARAAIGEPDAA